MDIKRIAAFILIVVISFGVVGFTSPSLLKNLRLGLDLKGGFEILYEASPIIAGEKVTRDSLLETANSLQRRANSSGVEEPDVTLEGTNRIRVKIAGVSDQDKVRAILSKPAELTFRGPDGKKELIGSDFVVGGAKVIYDNTTQQPIVEIKVKDAKKFEEITKRLTGKTLGIYLDEDMKSNPTVNYTITGGIATITGSKDLAEAQDLAKTINLGALPLKLTEKYTQTVGASLGQASLNDTVKASVIASVFILLFMLFMYRMPGVIASITLISYTWLLVLVLFLMNATLTLPGIAAFVLGMGMAVDANIITYERIKEEIRSGKSILSSLKAGSKNSFRTIIDANMTTIIAGAVLYYLGTGAIQGFALTLILSILVSIATNVFFARFLLNLLIRGNVLKKPEYFGVKGAEIREL